MLVSNVFYETISFPPTISPWPQFRVPHQEHHFDGQNIIILDSHEALVRANSLIQFLNRNLHIPKRLYSREVTRTAKSSCLYGLTLGIAGSFLLENPLPLLIGLSECFPRAYAQQKVGSEFQVNTYINSYQMHSSVASFSNGNFVVTWESSGQDGSGYGVYGQFFNGNGNKIGSEFRANSYTTDLQVKPSVTDFSNGNFIVTWESRYQDGDLYGVFGQLFDGNGDKIGNEFQANSYIIDSQSLPSVASLKNGNFVVTWQSGDQDGSGSGIYGQLFDGNGNKLGSEFQVNTYITNHQRVPAVTSLADGNFVVIWAGEGQGDTYGVIGQLFAENVTKIGNEFQVNTYITSFQASPSVASFSNGNFIVTWESGDQDGSVYGVYGQLFDGNGTKIETEFRVNTYTNNHQRVPAVTSFSNGNFVVTWESSFQDGSETGIYGQLFDGTATKIGTEFRVNTYTTDPQDHPSVASLADGNFVVTWESSGQDGSGYGVYGQIFHDNITYPPSSTTMSSSTISTTKTTFSTTSSKSSSTTSTTKTTSSTTSSISSSTSSSTKTTSSTTSSISSSTSSSTKTTSSTTPSVSSSALSFIVRTKTSVNLSSSRTAVPNTSRSIGTSNSRKTLPAISDPSNRFSWIWFLLGGVGAIFCLGLTGYLIFKSRKKDGNVHAFELGVREQTVDSTEMHYQRTSDHVTQESHYQRTPDFVTAGAGEETHYQRTPDFVTAGNGRH